MSNKIKAVVIDDSAFMRKSLSLMLESDEEIEVIGTARDGLEGFNQVKSLRPDIVTLDVEMPRMDGLTALKKIMEECPTPVLMVSSITTEGAEATLKALELGAIDFIPKELSYVSVNIVKIKKDLLQKVKEIVRQKSIQSRLKKVQESKPGLIKPVNVVVAPLPKRTYKAIAIGVSTGGPMSLQKVVPVISPKVNCPVFVVQHMPPKFTKSLADRLNSLSELEVKEAEDDEFVKNGFVYFAPGGYHMTLKKSGNGLPQIQISEKPDDTLHRPSVDIMVNSVVNYYGKNTLGVIMTGMGKDGFEALKILKNLGGSVIAQDEQSCVVYGMPKAIVEAGYADVVVPLEKIATTINESVL